MYANKYSQIILVIAIILGVISSGSGQGIFAAKVDSVKTGSGLPTVTSSPPIPKPTSDSGSTIEKKIVTCDAQCKVTELTDLGIRKEISTALVVNCKALADNPVHCIKFGASLVKNESGGGFKCRSRNQYNCSGMDVSAQYKSYDDGILHWVGKYNKYWYKAKDMSHFYSASGVLPPTRYCTSEDSSGSQVGCPHGLRISSSFYNKITF